MLFDRLCGIAEKQWKNPVLQRVLRDARLFEFPGRIHEKAEAKQWQGFGDTEFILDNFFLPFPVVAIEDTASCVVFVDDVPGQKGLGCPRLVIEIVDMHASSEEFGQRTSLSEARWNELSKQTPRGASVVSISKLTNVRMANDEERATKPNGTGIVFEGTSDIAFVASTDEMIVDPFTSRMLMREQGTEMVHTQAALSNAVAALEEIMYFNTPNHFVVERAPARVRDGKRSKRAPLLVRSEERPSYILLQPHEIRERFGIPDEPVHERKTPTPHARRRHYRTLSSDRYTTKKGEVIVVSASWVGPTEGTFKGRNYRVCLDL